MLLQMAEFPSFLWQSSIPLCVRGGVHLLKIHSSVDGCLICFHVLVVVNSAAVRTGMCVSY